MNLHEYSTLFSCKHMYFLRLVVLTDMALLVIIYKSSFNVNKSDCFIISLLQLLLQLWTFGISFLKHLYLFKRGLWSHVVIYHCFFVNFAEYGLYYCTLEDNFNCIHIDKQIIGEG